MHYFNKEKVDIKNCPPIPTYPAKAFGYSLGAWELGQTKEGEYYKYGDLNAPDKDPRILSYSGGETKVDQKNLDCWAAGYYRLRAYLKTPPPEYKKLVAAGYQGRFFQFQTDLRIGETGFRKISSYQDHLVKWVTVITPEGKCVEPTLKKFVDYVKKELEYRNVE